MKERNREIITSLVFLAFSLFGWYLTREIPEPFRDYDLGAAFLPRLVLGLIGALAVLKLVIAAKDWREKRKGAACPCRVDDCHGRTVLLLL